MGPQHSLIANLLDKIRKFKFAKRFQDSTKVCRIVGSLLYTLVNNMNGSNWRQECWHETMQGEKIIWGGKVKILLKFSCHFSTSDHEE
jgi:hypothetical protein